MSSPGDGDHEDLPDELPISQATALSAEAEVCISADTAENDGGDDGLPDELPASQDGMVVVTDSLAPGAQPSQSATSPMQSPDSGCEEAASPEHHNHKKRSVMHRPGRPHRALQEAMQAVLAAEASRQQVVEAAAVSLTPFRASKPQCAMPEELALPAKRRLELVDLARLGAAEMQGLLTKPIAGLCPLGPFPVAVWAASQLGASEAEARDDEALRVAQELLDERPFAMASKTLRAATLGVTPAKLQSLLPLLGSTTIVLCKHERSALEKHVASKVPRPDLVLYLDCVAYDETPLPVALRGEALQIPPTSGPERVAPTWASSVMVASLGAGTALSAKLRSDQGPQKILQTLQWGGLLFKVGQGQHVLILTSTLCPLRSRRASK